MPPEAITRNAVGLDLSPRVVNSTTVVASPTDSSETIIASITIPGNLAVASGIEVIGFAAFTIGTSGVSGNLKIRQTNVSGTTIAATGVVNAGVWAATQLTELYVAGFDTAAVLPGQVYKLTLTVGSGAGASTVSQVYLRALVV